MHNVSALVLTALIAWTMFLLILMEGLRVRFLVTRTVAANEFRPDNSNLPPFMQRLARAHANCIESFPIIGGLLVVALLTNRADVTDALAPWLLLARLLQSSIHLASTSVLAANARFLAFTVQITIAVYWLCELLTR
ncbi:MAG: MAPEG family protein [Thiobacillaceae bacterium]